MTQEAAPANTWALAGEPFGGYTTGSCCPFLLGASVAVPPLPSPGRGEAAVEGGQGREAPAPPPRPHDVKNTAGPR